MLLRLVGAGWGRGWVRHCSRLPPTIHQVVGGAGPLPRRVAVHGWVRATRRHKQTTFFDLGDGTSPMRLQVVADTASLPAGLGFHSCVAADGELVTSQAPGQAVELVADSVSLLAAPDPATYPFQPRRYVRPELVRRQPGAKAKTDAVAALLRVRSRAGRALQDWLEQQHFLRVETPVLTGNNCEGGAEVFSVTAPVMQAGEGETAPPYWDHPVHLTVSAQLHLEALCNGIGRVYSLGPAFRAERGRSRRHLSEFWMLEAEMAFVDELDVLIWTVESLLKHAASQLLEHCGEDLRLFSRSSKATGDNIGALEQFLHSEVAVVPYSEAVERLAGAGLGPLVGGDLGREHEEWLTAWAGRPVALINWPASTKPFYMRGAGGGAGLVAGLDLLVPGVGELAGGSLREFCPDLLASRAGPDMDWYVNLRRQGAAPTSGFGVGLERMIQYFVGVENIKDTIPFYRSPHNCLL